MPRSICWLSKTRCRERNRPREERLCPALQRVPKEHHGNARSTGSQRGGGGGECLFSKEKMAGTGFGTKSWRNLEANACQSSVSFLAIHTLKHLPTSRSQKLLRAPGRERGTQCNPPQQNRRHCDMTECLKHTHSRTQNYFSRGILKFLPQGSIRLLQQPWLCRVS